MSAAPVTDQPVTDQPVYKEPLAATILVNAVVHLEAVMESVAGSDKDYAYANDDNDHEDDHEDDHGEDEYELSDEQAAEARGALL